MSSLENLLNLGVGAYNLDSIENTYDDARSRVRQGLNQGIRTTKNYLQPWADFGTDMGEGYQGLGEFDFSYDNYLDSDNYNWLREQQEKSLMRQHAASPSGFLSGKRLVDLERDMTEWANAQYGQEFDRQLQGYGANQQYWGTGAALGAGITQDMAQTLGDLALGRGITEANLAIGESEAIADAVDALLGDTGDTSFGLDDLLNQLLGGGDDFLEDLTGGIVGGDGAVGLDDLRYALEEFGGNVGDIDWDAVFSGDWTDFGDLGTIGFDWGDSTSGDLGAGTIGGSSQEMQDAFDRVRASAQDDGLWAQFGETLGNIGDGLGEVWDFITSPLDFFSEAKQGIVEAGTNIAKDVLGNVVGKEAAASAAGLASSVMSSLGLAGAVLGGVKFLDSINWGKGGASNSTKVPKFMQRLRGAMQADPTGRKFAAQLDGLVSGKLWAGEENRQVVQELLSNGVIDYDYAKLHGHKSIYNLWEVSPENIEKRYEYREQSGSLLDGGYAAGYYQIRRPNDEGIGFHDYNRAENERMARMHPSMIKAVQGAYGLTDAQAERYANLVSITNRGPMEDTLNDVTPGEWQQAIEQREAFEKNWLTERRKLQTAKKMLRRIRERGFRGDLSKIKDYIAKNS